MVEQPTWKIKVQIARKWTDVNNIFQNAAGVNLILIDKDVSSVL